MPGIRCPRCGCSDMRDDRGLPSAERPNRWEVINTQQQNGYIRRRRRCRYCGKYIYTRERIEQ